MTVLPLHHPIRVAEQWATLDLLSNGRVDFAVGRGCDRREYLPFHVSFENNQRIFEEGLEVVRKLWEAPDRISYHGRHYSFDDVRITPKPVQNPIPTYVASFLAARLGCGLIVAPFAAAGDSEDHRTERGGRIIPSYAKSAIAQHLVGSYDSCLVFGHRLLT